MCFLSSPLQLTPLTSSLRPLKKTNQQPPPFSPRLHGTSARAVAGAPATPPTTRHLTLRHSSSSCSIPNALRLDPSSLAASPGTFLCSPVAPPTASSPVAAAPPPCWRAQLLLAMRCVPPAPPNGELYGLPCRCLRPGAPSGELKPRRQCCACPNRFSEEDFDLSGVAAHVVV